MLPVCLLLFSKFCHELNISHKEFSCACKIKLL